MKNDKSNLLLHLVTDEAGTTSLLATLLDPIYEHSLHFQLVEHLREMLHGISVDVPDGPLSRVECEYDGIDLVLAWGNWIVAIENKVAGASITRGQLNRYYKKLIRKNSKQDVLGIPTGKAQICIVFLTPTLGVGGTEFQSLELESDRKDGKLHFSWSELLGWLDSIGSEQPGDTYAQIIHDGGLRVRAVIENRHKTKTIDDENRRGMKALMSEIKKSIQAFMVPNVSMKLTDWRDPQCEEVYTGVSGGNGNVYLRIHTSDSNCEDPDALDVDAAVEFKVANKAPASLKKWFSELNYRRVAGLLGASENAMSIQNDRWSLVHRSQMQGTQSELADRIASMFVRFACIFEALIKMRESGSTP